MHRSLCFGDNHALERPGDKTREKIGKIALQISGG